MPKAGGRRPAISIRIQPGADSISLARCRSDSEPSSSWESSMTSRVARQGAPSMVVTTCSQECARAGESSDRQMVSPSVVKSTAGSRSQESARYRQTTPGNTSATWARRWLFPYPAGASTRPSRLSPTVTRRSRTRPRPAGARALVGRHGRPHTMSSPPRTLSAAGPMKS